MKVEMLQKYKLHVSSREQWLSTGERLDWGWKAACSQQQAQTTKPLKSTAEFLLWFVHNETMPRPSRGPARQYGSPRLQNFPVNTAWGYIICLQRLIVLGNLSFLIKLSYPGLFPIKSTCRAQSIVKPNILLWMPERYFKCVFNQIKPTYLMRKGHVWEHLMNALLVTARS